MDGDLKTADRSLPSVPFHGSAHLFPPIETDLFGILLRGNLSARLAARRARPALAAGCAPRRDWRMLSKMRGGWRLSHQRREKRLGPAVDVVDGEVAVHAAMPPLTLIQRHVQRGVDRRGHRFRPRARVDQGSRRRVPRRQPTAATAPARRGSPGPARRRIRPTTEVHAVAQRRHQTDRAPCGRARPARRANRRG